MSEKSNKKIITAFIATVLVFAFQTLDVFFIHVDGSLFGGNVVARLAGIAVFIIASFILKFNVRNFCFRRYGFVFEILIGIFFAAVPVALCYGAEYLFFTVKGYENIFLNVSFPNTNDLMSLKGRLLAIGLFIFTVLLQSLFKELFFRGFLISQLFKKFGLLKANLVQTVLYTLFLVPTIAQNIISGRFSRYGLVMTAFIIGCNLLADFISGYKWGLYYRVNGTVWMSTADHFVNNMLLTCVYVTDGMMPLKWYVIQTIVIQLISFAMFIPLYYKRDKQNEEIAAEIAIQRELAGMTVDNYSPSPTRRYIENRRFDKQTELAKKRNMPLPVKQIRFPQDFEEPVSLQDTEFFGAERLAESINVTEIKESVPEEKQKEIEDMKSAPSEKSKEFFDEMTQKNLNTDVDITHGIKEEDVKETDSVQEGGNSNISKLVQGYFEENFNKHTF